MKSTISYPFEIENGDLKLAQGTDCDYCAMIAVIRTRPLERVRRPLSFGYKPPLFEAVMANVEAKRLEVVLLSQVPDLVEVGAIGSLDEEGRLVCEILWSTATEKGEFEVKVSA